MKTYKTKIALLTIAFCFSFKTMATSYKIPNVVVANPDSVWVIENIQEGIYNAYIQSIISKTSIALDSIDTQLEEVQSKKNQDIITYWQGYLQYYTSIYYLKNGDKKYAGKVIEKGISAVKEIKGKDSEDYALLSLMRSFSIQFKGDDAPVAAKEMKQYAEKAITLDSTNLRAQYVFASYDFNTPKKYDGKQKTEKHLLKAISLPIQKINSIYLPSWGKEEAYELLIIYYLDQDDKTNALKYYVEAIKVFPQSFALKQLSKEFNFDE